MIVESTYFKLFYKSTLIHATIVVLISKTLRFVDNKIHSIINEYVDKNTLIKIM